MSSCEAPTFCPRNWALAVLLYASSGCAAGVDGTDEGLTPIDMVPGAAVFDAGFAPPTGPVLDAGPIVPPLPPSLSTPQESSVPLPPPREAGTATRTPTTGTGTGTRTDAGTTGTGSFGGGGTRGGTTAGGTTTTGCNALRCTNECSLAGPLQCCTLLDTCGCTWAPGAYCL